MNTRHVFDFETAPVSFRSACDMSRACSPICASPISPSISAFGTSAATESTTTTSTPFDLADGDLDGLEAFAVLTVVSFDGGHARAPVTRGKSRHNSQLAGPHPRS